jgi:hypothetical protein
MKDLDEAALRCSQVTKEQSAAVLKLLRDTVPSE